MGFLGFGAKEEPGKVAEYAVVYKGGHPTYPKARSGQLDLKIFQDHFELHPTIGSKSWFTSITIPFSWVTDLKFVEREVSTVEGLLGGLDSRQLNQKNNIHIHYFQTPEDNEMVLRLEMLSGITVWNQAAKCRELEDTLRNNRIRERFRPSAPQEPEPGCDDIPGQIEKLAALRDKGILSEEEFAAKKKELLSRL